MRVAPKAMSPLAFAAMEPLQQALLFLPVLVLSVVVHEYAHAWQARREGDDTALLAGRLTLNPISHIDLFGSILFPLILLLSRAAFLFGWAKPVPVDPRKFRNYRAGDIRVSLAGIVSNLILAAISTLLMGLFINASRMIPSLSTTFDLLRAMAEIGLRINLVLAFFNLIPIPPLDS